MVGMSTRQGPDDFQLIAGNESAQQALSNSIAEAKEQGDWLTGIFLQGTLQAIEDPAAYMRKITSNLPKAAFVFLPLFALLQMLVNLRQNRYYIDYLVFSLNFHAFSFLLIACVLLAGLVSSVLGDFLKLFYFFIPVYGIIAFHTFSQQGWGKSILKGILVFGAYAALLVFGIAFYFAAVLFL